MKYIKILKIYRDELYLNFILILNSIHNLIENNIDIVKNLKLIEGLNIMKSITLNKKEKILYCILYFLKKLQSRKY